MDLASYQVFFPMAKEYYLKNKIKQNTTIKNAAFKIPGLRRKQEMQGKR